MAEDTALDVLTDIIEGLGGTTDATTLVPALKDLQGRLGPDGLEQYVYGWLDEHGATAGYSVTDGDLTITLT